MKNILEEHELKRVFDGAKSPCQGCRRYRNYLFITPVPVRVGSFGLAIYPASSKFCHVCIEVGLRQADLGKGKE